MTTGRINQIPYLAGVPGRRRGRTQGHPGPPGGTRVVYTSRGVTTRAVRGARRTGAPNAHPIAPTKPLSAGPHAGRTARPRGGRWPAAACRVRAEDRTPVVTLAKSGYHRAAPSQSLQASVARGQASTDSISAGDDRPRASAPAGGTRHAGRRLVPPAPENTQAQRGDRSGMEDG